MMASTAAAWDLRDLLGYDSGALAKGLMLIRPGQRAELRRLLDLADSLSEPEAREKRMTLAQNVESAVGHILADIERGVRDFDGQALKDARKAVADVEAAEKQGAELAVKYKTEILVVAKVLEPEAKAALTALAGQLAADFAGLFAIAQ
jgi:hypothetical protein